MLSIASQSPRTTVARKISLVGGGFLVLVLAAICGVMTVLLAQRAQERTVAWADAKVQAVAQSVDAYDQTAKLLVERELLSPPLDFFLTVVGAEENKFPRG